MSRKRLIAVVGATATGKSDVAVALAEAFDGEVISTDAYQVYRGLDIGTAKTGQELRARVPHHLIDVAEPGEALTLATFLQLARSVLDNVWLRGQLPVLAGGSGQYVWALLEGWQVPRVEPNPALRAELETLIADEGMQALRARMAALDPAAASRIDASNPRRLIRAIEVVSGTGLPLAACQTRTPLDAAILIIGLDLPREELFARLDTRTDEMYARGFVSEVQRLRAQGYSEAQAVRGGVGYKEVSACLDGEYSLDEAITRHKSANRRLVRRQNAWFKPGDPRITWLAARDGAPERAVSLARAWLQTQAH